jgi:2-dehydro-3-deoxyphosphogluconate aldolase / (4S)-4-hydroxy-2-oxoglutarate aldolase
MPKAGDSSVMTPNDIGSLMRKFFPASAAGGVAMLKSLATPYAHLCIEFIPTGTLTSGSPYLDVPHVAAVGSTWIGSAEDIASQAWSEITRCREVHQHVFEMTGKL